MLLIALAFQGLERAELRAARIGARLAFVALLVVLGIATHRRNDVYRDEVVFWRDVIAKSPGNARAHNNLGIALAERCDAEGAERAWREALALDPGFVRAAVNRRLLQEGHVFAPGCRPARD
jgi:Flp pilus assembly protein TadD